MNMPVLNPAVFGGREVINADTHLAEAEKVKVLSGNAAKLYKISV